MIIYISLIYLRIVITNSLTIFQAFYVKFSYYFVIPDVFITQLTALKTSRSVKTRRLALAEESTELTQTARLAQILHQILKSLLAAKG